MKDRARFRRLLLPALSMLGGACEGTPPEPSARKVAPSAPSTPVPTTPAPPAPPTAPPGAGTAALAAPSPGELSPARVGELCAAVCKKTSALPCVNMQACQTACTDNFTIPICRGELGAMLSCTATAPLERFMCGPGGAPALLDGTCDPEQERAAGCLTRMMENGAAQPR